MCIVCKHNQVKDLDRALLTGASLASLSETYGVSTLDLDRHHQHLVHKMAQAQKRFHDGLRQGLYCKLNIVMEMVLGVVRGAKAGGDFKLFLQASREFTRLISLMNKMAVQLEPEMIYCLMASPQWDLQDNLLPHAFQALSDTRQTLKVNLFAPCPDPAPESELDKAPPAALGTRNSEPAIQSAELNPAPRPIVDPIPAHPQAAQFPTINRETATATRPQNKREISAKLARKNGPFSEYI